MDIQTAIKCKMTEVDISQTQLAKNINWTTQNLSYKLNKSNVKYRSVIKLAEAFGLSLKFKSREEFEGCLTPRGQFVQDTAEKMAAAAINTSISIGDFQTLINNMEVEAILDWKKPGDKLYTITEKTEE